MKSLAEIQKEIRKHINNNKFPSKELRTKWVDLAEQELEFQIYEQVLIERCAKLVIKMLNENEPKITR